MDLTKYKELLNKPKYILIAGIILGLILGMILFWGLFPVKWTDASAEHLRADLQQDYLRMAINSFAVTGDQAKAQQLYQELGEHAETTLKAINEAPEYLSMEQVLKFSQAVSAEQVILETVEAQPEAETPADEQPEAEAPVEEQPEGEEEVEEEIEEERSGFSKFLRWLGFAFILLLVAAAVLVYLIFFKDRVRVRKEPLPEAPLPAVDPVILAPTQAGKSPSMAIPGQERPVAQNITTYMFGDDLFDDSFTFDAPNGDFLGECGVSISDTIGVGEPKKISAFEIWLFDKNDVQTVTKVLMSAHVFDEPALRQRLESKGEPIMAAPGKQILLETATLQLQARIMDMQYGEIPLPEQSYFQRLSIELAVYQK